MMLGYFLQKPATLRTFAANTNVNGTWTKGAATDSDIGIIEPQPLVESELQWLPEHDRKRAHFITWTPTDVDIHGPGENRDADRIIYDGDVHEVVKSGHWRGGGFREIIMYLLPGETP